MRKYSCTVLALFASSALLCSAVVAQDNAVPVASEPPITTMATVVVSGKQPGPGLWRVSRSGHDLWILGTLSPLPKRMDWESGKVERLVAKSQELLAPPSVSVSAKLGIFSQLALIPTALRARNDPNGRTLQEQVAPAVYQRWLVLKKRYLGRNKAAEKRRPIMAANKLFGEALDDNDLSQKQRVWPVLRKAAKKAKIVITEPKETIEIADPKKTFREMAKTPLADAACFEATLQRLETDLDSMKARANAWAVGDLQTLIDMPHVEESRVCADALLATQIAEREGISDLRERMRQRWLQAAEAALAKNASTVAALPIENLLRSDGMLAALRERGYTVVAPQ